MSFAIETALSPDQIDELNHDMDMDKSNRNQSIDNLDLCTKYDVGFSTEIIFHNKTAFLLYERSSNHSNKTNQCDLSCQMHPAVHVLRAHNRII